MQKNIANRTIFCHDNLAVMRGLDSESIDLIYLDPPFNKKKTFTAPVGSSAKGASFSDIFRKEDIKEEWLQEIAEDHFAIHDLLQAVKAIEGRASYNFCYLAYMAIRLMECHRILRQTGGLYLHCDPTMSHYLKLLLDCIFGEKGFRNEIVWCYHGPGSPNMRQFNRKTDHIFWYSKGRQWVFNKDDVRQEYKDARPHVGGYGLNRETADEYGRRGKVPENWWEIRIAARSKTEYTGYPTQKPLMLLNRIVAASSNRGDVVLDPFCGCATTCVAAERLGRKWIGIDISVKAYELVKKRLSKEVEQEAPLLYDKLVTFATEPPKRADKGGGAKSQKYVYVIANRQYPGEYKVGIAKDVNARLNSYQTAAPNRGYTLKFSLLTPHYRRIERRIHAVFENKHEWVRGDLAKIKEAIKSWKPQ